MISQPGHSFHWRRPLGKEEVSSRAKLLLSMLVREGGAAEVSAVLSEPERFDGTVSAEEASLVLEAAMLDPEIDGPTASRLAMALPAIARAAPGVDVLAALEALRERFPKECSDGAVLAREVMEG